MEITKIIHPWPRKCTHSMCLIELNLSLLSFPHWVHLYFPMTPPSLILAAYFMKNFSLSSPSTSSALKIVPIEEKIRRELIKVQSLQRTQNLWIFCFNGRIEKSVQYNSKVHQSPEFQTWSRSRPMFSLYGCYLVVLYFQRHVLEFSVLSSKTLVKNWKSTDLT